MTPRPILLAALLAATPALAQPRPQPGGAPAQGSTQGNAQGNTQPGGPQRLGNFGTWIAATHQEPAGKVCYAFTRVEGGGRPNVILTVTHRPQGRDQVALRIGRSFPRNAEVTVTADGKEHPFYTAGDNAFARDGRATVAAFRDGDRAVARSPGPNNRGTTTDNFSLTGFSAAYDAITRECPAAGGPRR